MFCYCLKKQRVTSFKLFLDGQMPVKPVNTGQVATVVYEWKFWLHDTQINIPTWIRLSNLWLYLTYLIGIINRKHFIEFGPTKKVFIINGKKIKMGIKGTKKRAKLYRGTPISTNFNGVKDEMGPKPTYKITKMFSSTDTESLNNKILYYLIPVIPPLQFQVPLALLSNHSHSSLGPSHC